MGKFSECLSWSCFSSSSPQQPPNAGPSHSTFTSPSQFPQQSANAGTPTSPSPSQQPSNAGRSTSPSSSQLTQQPANPGTSTSPSSSQLPQQPSISGPSTSTTTPFVFNMQPSELPGLIKYIEDELKKSTGNKYEGEKCKEGCSYGLRSHIQEGQRFLEFADKHIDKLHGEMKSKDGFSAEIPKILTDLLRGAGKIHWVGAVFSVLGFVLNNINEMSPNKEKCLEMLRAMVNLGYQLIGLKEEIPKHKDKLEEAAECILEGCRMCTAQLSTGKFRRFQASANADTLNGFNVKIDRLYHEIQTMLLLDIHERVPKIAPSQGLYAHPGAVGIESAQDDVIKLLDLSAQHNSARVVVVHGLGGIGKTTLADAVYASIDLQNYNYCRIHMEQNCTNNDIKVLQQQMLKRLFSKIVIIDGCDQGREMIRSLSKQNDNKRLFLYIDNGLKSTDLQEFLPADLGNWLPLKSRILVTTRNLQETDLFDSRNVQRHAYAVIPLPDREARELLLKKVLDYTDESYIDRLLELCGGVPLLLELAGSQLAINSKSRKNIVLEMLSQGEKVEDEDISDRLVDFVYHRLLPPVQQAFLRITTCLYKYSSNYVMSVVGEEAFRALEEASFIKIDESGELVIHHMVRARGKWMSEQEGNIIIDKESLYPQLHSSVASDVPQRLPKIASDSQELYAHPGAVGIESAQDEVIKLLDLSAQPNSARVVVLHGFGGIGKTTLADAVYSRVNLSNYNKCRIHMAQNCTKNDIKALQEQILSELFSKNLKLNNCDQGRGMIKSLSRQKQNRPLFLYIDNGLKSTDLQELLPADLEDWLPLKSRMLVTTRNLQETDLFVSRNVQRHAYAVIPLPDREAREILLKKVPDYTDESYMDRPLHLCRGVPRLLELAGSQLAINTESRTNIVLDMLRQGVTVENEDISDRMVDFVYRRLLPPVQEAFLDITTCLYNWSAEAVRLIVGEEEFEALEEASFIKSVRGHIIIHDIIRARGKWMSEQGHRITDRESLSNCLVDEEKLKKVKGIYIDETSDIDDEKSKQHPIEINESHLNCMSDSLRILGWEEFSVIKWKGKCRKPFKKLRCLRLPSGISDLPMEFEKLEHLSFYCGPMTQEMSLYELPPTLRYMMITNIISCENGVAYSRIPPNLTPPSSLVRLTFWKIEGMERLPNGVEKLTKLEILEIWNWPKLKKLPSKIGDLTNLKEITLVNCRGLEEWPSSFGNLSKLESLDLEGCSSKLKKSVPSHLKKIVH